jgi:hypothetical protein
VVVACALLPQAARAECGRAAQTVAHTILIDAEKMPVGDAVSRTAVLAKLGKVPIVMACPDDPPKVRAAVAASYQVYTAWRNTINAFVVDSGLRDSPATNKRCEGVWTANLRDSIANAYDAFSQTAQRNTSPDDAHVIAYLRGKARTLGFSLPAPYSFRFAAAPLRLQADTVRAHLPAGVMCY